MECLDYRIIKEFRISKKKCVYKCVEKNEGFGRSSLVTLLVRFNELIVEFDGKRVFSIWLDF